ncbi:hypothetical protein PRIO_5605 [Paenibacillus riograndensis SBR5]|uniref:Uroporphyrin-III C-methyltransferase n=2 Tax=Paenibacillus riograndensis TaxID=483937 RepID=A0A0E4CYY1_9BACL|nr:hypothetical protein PRIO_5605 [Paenibacillus riograndensis SBR5]
MSSNGSDAVEAGQGALKTDASSGEVTSTGSGDMRADAGTDMLRIKRIYAPPEAADGRRVLVDRLWPRGVSKESAQLDDWMREAAPSPELRKWFAHKPDKFAEFAVLYEEELQSEPAAGEMERLCDWARESPVTLLYAAKDERHNHARVLRDAVLRRLSAHGS